MTTVLRQRVTAAKDNLMSKRTKEGWILPREKTTFGDDDTWTNIDCDPTPLERRTWTPLTMLGFWISDAMNAQGWEAPSSIIAVGLTWREAIYCIIIGSTIDTIPLVLNGVIGANLHVPFPVAVRSSFGFYFSRFAVIVRLITALFWFSIQTYTGSTAMGQCIRAIFPSFLNIPNHLPASAGITTQEMISHFVFWSIQFPFMLTPPHKIRWFFILKSIVVVISSVGVVIAMTQKAGGTGDIWNQQATVSGSTKSWLILSSMSSITGGWATMATNIPDFTRYLNKPQGVYWQAFFLPFISIMLGLFGIISTSCAKIVYGEYIWNPLTLAAQWDGPAGRAGAFFVGFTWVIAQIGTNLSANVISCANDLTNLFPKYINIRRGVVLATITAGWIMVPWKIITSAASLLSFMTGLGIFLAPIAAILACDYWIVKNKHIDIPSLYRKTGRYRYNEYGTNWRAAIAFLISVVPNIPGMAVTVNPNLHISDGINHVYEMYYLWGFTSAGFVYWALSRIWPAEETILLATVYEDDAVDGESVGGDTEKSDGAEGEKKGVISGIEATA